MALASHSMTGWTPRALAPLLNIPNPALSLQDKDAARGSESSCEAALGYVPCTASQSATKSCATPWHVQSSPGMGHREPGWGCMWGVGALMALGACDGALSPGDTVCVMGVCVHKA